MVKEIVFFHRPSASLVIVNLAFNVGESSAPMTKLFFRMNRAYGRLAHIILERFLVRDRSAWRASLERILEWSFGRVIVARGDVCETGSRDELVRSYGWLLG